ncbi:MAG: hypothetical protein L0216_10795 [Planctomycetales bacterium]|nr:hypothetical protein [Planctomycetales bacterium]
MGPMESRALTCPRCGSGIALVPVRKAGKLSRLEWLRANHPDRVKNVGHGKLTVRDAMDELEPEYRRYLVLLR